VAFESKKLLNQKFVQSKEPFRLQNLLKQEDMKWRGFHIREASDLSKGPFGLQKLLILIDF
jgi:hypothetical protein